MWLWLVSPSVCTPYRLCKLTKQWESISQPHSQLNMFQKANDTKSNLILNLLSWVDFLQPQYCIFENVHGFLSYNLNVIQVDEHQTTGGISMGGLKFLVHVMLTMKYVVPPQYHHCHCCVYLETTRYTNPLKQKFHAQCLATESGYENFLPFLSMLLMHGFRPIHSTQVRLYMLHQKTRLCQSFLPLSFLVST